MHISETIRPLQVPQKVWALFQIELSPKKHDFWNLADFLQFILGLVTLICVGRPNFALRMQHGCSIAWPWRYLPPDHGEAGAVAREGEWKTRLSGWPDGLVGVKPDFLLLHVFTCFYMFPFNLSIAWTRARSSLTVLKDLLISLSDHLLIPRQRCSLTVKFFVWHIISPKLNSTPPKCLQIWQTIDGTPMDLMGLAVFWFGEGISSGSLSLILVIDSQHGRTSCFSGRACRAAGEGWSPKDPQLVRFASWLH